MYAKKTIKKPRSKKKVISRRSATVARGTTLPLITFCPSASGYTSLDYYGSQPEKRKVAAKELSQFFED